VDGQVVSSTRIRSLVQAGDVREASRCLGRPYRLSGPVIQGARRGQGLGWPTANLKLPPERVIPADGVYVSRAYWNESVLESVSYIGSRPTFGTGERLVEVHILDEQPNLYGKEIAIEFVERLRGDLVFDTAEELSARIDLDVRLARDVLKTESQPVSDA
ncbi:MAG: riboflavin kinase, partial [Nitrospiraceae bacterium]